VLAVAAVLLAACTSAPGRPDQNTPPAPAPGSVPNIVLVLTDDLSMNLLPYMPNVAAMAQHGVSFTNYFVIDSLCCPSRSAIFTGQFPHNNGVFTNHGADGGYQAYTAHGDAQKSFAIALHNAGYRTAMMGKYLNEYLPTYRQPVGWDEWDVTGRGYNEFNYLLNENGRLHRYGHSPRDYLTDVLKTKASQFIDGALSRKRPFALEVATFAPHAPSTPAPRDALDFPGLTAPRTRAFDRISTGAPRWLAARPPLSAKAQQSIDAAFRKRVRAVQAVDDMVGALRAQLQAKGLADNTYFVFSSDNGYHMGEHRLLPGKQTAFDTDIRVPLIVTGPGIAPGRTLTAMTSSIDLAPTFEDLAGTRPTAQRDGTSLVGLLHGLAARPGRPNAVLVEHHGPPTAPGDPDRQPPRAGNPPSYEAIRSANSLYVEYVTGEREYYDLRSDPDELHNLAATVPPARLALLQQALHALETCRGASACGAAARLP
jgi:N-acetylglucosamine-6-sulfatase